MSLSDTQWAFLLDVAKLIEYANAMGFKLTGGELSRTVEQQKIHFDAGRSKTMNSQHLKRLAIDFNIFLDGQYLDNDTAKVKARPLGDYWEYLHPDNVWGGSWGWDTPHFERKG